MQKQQNQMPLAEPAFCVRFMKLFLVILNVVVLILGITSLTIGIWSLTDDYGADNIEVIMETDLYTAVSVILIVGGVVVIITAILGGVGALLGNRTMLGIYFGIMILFCLVFIVGAIVAFFFLDEVEDSLAEKMESTLKNKYEVNTNTNEENKDITIVWDDIQRKLKCCGVRGGLTSTESWFLWQSSQWFTTEGQAALNPANHIYVPSSCCNTNYIFDQCQEIDAGQPAIPPKTSVAAITTSNPALYHTGCLDALEEEINEHIIGITVVAILIFLLMIVCAVFSLMVCMEAGRIGKVV